MQSLTALTALTVLTALIACVTATEVALSSASPVAALAALADGPDFDTAAIATAGGSGSGLVVTQFRYALPRQTVSVTLARVANAWPYFEVQPPYGSGGDPFTCHRVNTTVTAAADGCQFATNGGFFDMATGGCMGNVVSGGDVLERDDTWPHPTFGTRQTAAGPEFVIGYYNVSAAQRNAVAETEADADAVDAVSGLHAAMSGIGWLVRGGQSYINESAAREGLSGGSFLTEIAPRTAIGFDANGQLLLLVVDGEEDIKSGATLYELVDILLSAKVGAAAAMNLDGGGSTVAVYNGQIISRPTCIDTPKICQRAVTTITCVLATANAEA